MWYNGVTQRCSPELPLCSDRNTLSKDVSISKLSLNTFNKASKKNRLSEDLSFSGLGGKNELYNFTFPLHHPPKKANCHPKNSYSNQSFANNQSLSLAHILRAIIKTEPIIILAKQPKKTKQKKERVISTCSFEKIIHVLVQVPNVRESAIMSLIKALS